MRLHFLYTALFLGSLVTMLSCNKASVSNTFVPTHTDTTWFATDTTPPITASLTDPLLVDSFDCTKGGITFGGGANDSITIIFPQNGCMTNPQSPSSTIRTKTIIRVEVQLIKSKGGIIKSGKPSTANAFGRNYLLDAGFFINIKLIDTRTNNIVYWNPTIQQPIIIGVKDKKINTNDTAYFSFQPVSGGQDSAWVGNQITSNGGCLAGIKFQNNIIPVEYIIETNSIGWQAAGDTIPVPPANVTTRINAAFSSVDYTNKNTSVYAVFKNKKTVIRLASNPRGKTFGTDKIIPTNNDSIQVVSISKINNQYFTGTTGYFLPSGPQPIIINPTSIPDISGLKAFLDNL